MKNLPPNAVDKFLWFAEQGQLAAGAEHAKPVAEQPAWDYETAYALIRGHF